MLIEVMPGVTIGGLLVVSKEGTFNGEVTWRCADERERNIVYLESEIIAMAGSPPEVEPEAEEEVEDTPEQEPEATPEAEETPEPEKVEKPAAKPKKKKSGKKKKRRK